MRVLLVEDDQALGKSVERFLKEENYEVDLGVDGEEGLWLAKLSDYDVFIFDVMMPKLDGFTLIKKLRQEGIKTPTLLLTAKDRVEDRVKGLDLGADDYLTKPFAGQELLARLRSLLRRAGKLEVEGKLTYGKIQMDVNQHEGFVDESPLRLTIKEYELLMYMIQNKEQILTRDQIFERVWGVESDTTDSIVDLYIHYLRKKLAPFEMDKSVRTVRGVGYMLKER